MSERLLAEVDRKIVETYLLYRAVKDAAKELRWDGQPAETQEQFQSQYQQYFSDVREYDAQLTKLVQVRRKLLLTMQMRKEVTCESSS